VPLNLSSEDRLSIGQRITTLREMYDLTQGALAAKVNVSQPAVSQWEAGTILPRRETQFILADALHTTRSRLFRELAEAECAATGGAA
jgi:transcriptional regulator with XRE-family HTH domain